MKIAHVCLYPEPNRTHTSQSGVASYTKNLLRHMPTDSEIEHIVLCARIDGKNQTHQDGNVTVIRCFDRTPGFVLQLHRELKKLQPDVIHIQHELALFGGLLTAYLLPALVWLWRRKVTITLHGVVAQQHVTTQFVTANNFNVPPFLVRIALKILYWPLSHWPARVVVHELYFKQILIVDYCAKADRIAVIPHGIEAFATPTQTDARTAMQIAEDRNVVLFVGYAAGYKGIDLLIEGFAEYAKQDPRALLLIGAGVHPKLKNDPAHKETYFGYQQKAAQLIPIHQYRWIGFVPEEQIAEIYSAADVAVYPYNVVMASSGPMAFAIGNNRPFLASTAFANVLKKDYTFEPSPGALAAKLREFFAEPTAFADYTKRLYQERLWPQVSSQTVEVYKQIG